MLTVLSAMAHGESELGAAIAAAVLPAVRGLDDERARFYGDLVLNSLNEAARRALEAMMKGYEFQSDFAKKYIALGRGEGEARALCHSCVAPNGVGIEQSRIRRATGSSPKRTSRGWNAGWRTPALRPP